MATSNTIRIFNHSEYCFKIIHDHNEYTLDPQHSVELYLDDTSVEIELVQLSQTIRWNILKIFSLILGLIFIPILNLVLMVPLSFTNEISPLLVHGRYLLKADVTQETIILRLLESTYDGQCIKTPKIKFENTNLSLLKESYEINQKNIKGGIFYCIYNVSFLVFLGLCLTIIALINVDEIAIKIMIAVIVFPLLFVPIISTIVSIRKKKIQLYKLLSSFTKPM